MSQDETIARAIAVLESATSRLAAIDARLDTLTVDLRVCAERQTTIRETLRDHEGRLRDAQATLIRVGVGVTLMSALASMLAPRILGQLLP